MIGHRSRTGPRLNSAVQVVLRRRQDLRVQANLRRRVDQRCRAGGRWRAGAALPCPISFPFPHWAAAAGRWSSAVQRRGAGSGGTIHVPAQVVVRAGLRLASGERTGAEPRAGAQPGRGAAKGLALPAAARPGGDGPAPTVTQTVTQPPPVQVTQPPPPAWRGHTL